MTAKVLHKCPLVLRQVLQLQMADFKGMALGGRETVEEKRPQWQDAWRVRDAMKVD